jgi:hypothetical protein
LRIPAILDENRIGDSDFAVEHKQPDLVGSFACIGHHGLFDHQPRRDGNIAGFVCQGAVVLRQPLGRPRPQNVALHLIVGADQGALPARMAALENIRRAKPVEWDIVGAGPTRTMEQVALRRPSTQ